MVSVNLVNDALVRELLVDGKRILRIEVPRAGRKQRPVYLTSNALDAHSYRRLKDADCRVSDEDVKRMTVRAHLERVPRSRVSATDRWLAHIAERAASSAAVNGPVVGEYLPALANATATSEIARWSLLRHGQCHPS